jgi:dienelactone hydrolase
MRSSLTRTIIATAALATMAGAPALADAGSLPSVSGSRPGPDLLYAPAADAPQLTNAGPWKAAPILISGASAYRSGEFLYQDFLYDDHGAHEQMDPSDRRNPGDAFSKPNGTYTYPSDRAYADNAADFVELRAKPLADATALRVTLNTLKDASQIAFSVAIGGTPGAALPFPAGANVRAPAEMFLTVHPGAGGALVGELVKAGTNTPVPGGSPVVSVDMARRQIDVRIPKAAWDPGGRTVRLAAGIGLWDKAAGRYLVPQPAGSAGTPGGSGAAAAAPAFFNVAFRYDEPFPKIGDLPGTAAGPAWWRDKAQGETLATGDISALHANVDFGKLAAGTDDDLLGEPGGTPVNGPLARILASHFESQQGADHTEQCLRHQRSCKGAYQGNLQPYSIYVPRKAAPAQGFGLTLLLHALSTNYNLFAGGRNQSEFGERGPGSIVITPEARGVDGFYFDVAGADVFEVWADVARHYKLDADFTSIAGYSMGAIGTFKLAQQFPDLFARAQPTVGDSPVEPQLPSLRNIPILMWNGQGDELVPPSSYLPTANALDALGYRYALDVYQPGEHNSLAINDEYTPAAGFLGDAKVDRDPPHVTFAADPSIDYPKLSFVADHAYWVSAVRLREAGTDKIGLVDVRSQGFGVGEPPVTALPRTAGSLPGGNVLNPYPFVRELGKEWGPAPATPKRNQLDVRAENVRSFTVDARRARVSCNPQVNVTGSGPRPEITLTGCEAAQGLPPAGKKAACVDTRAFRFRLGHAKGARVVKVKVSINGKRKLLRRGRSLTRITLGRLPKRTFRVTIVSTQSTGVTRVSTRTYRGCTKSRPRTRQVARRKRG